MTFGLPPTLGDIEILARAALAELPEPFASQLRPVVLIVEDFPPEDMLAELGIEDPFELTGLYTGRPAGLEATTGDLPPMIHLFRRPILDEWIASAGPDEAAQSGGLINCGLTLAELIRHIVIHETGHHFGLSDDDMEWMEEELRKGSANQG